jgi:hypothetical protein
MLAMSDLFDMALRWISLALIAAILAAEGYLLFDRTFYGPLKVIDWSGRVKELLFGATREQVKDATDAATDMEFASMVRSVMDPLTVCGMVRLRSGSGAWENWIIFDILLPGDHPLLKATFRVPVLQGMTSMSVGKRLLYQVNGGDRAVTPRDRFKCEPSTCEKCDRYDWLPIAEVEQRS